MIAQIPVSPSATDPNSYGAMIERIGVPMGCLLLFVIPTLLIAYFILRWCFGEKGFIREGFGRWIDAQVAAFNGIRVDIDALKLVADKGVFDHVAQDTAHRATITAGHHALDALGKIGKNTGADVDGDIKAARQSLDESVVQKP